MAAGLIKTCGKCGQSYDEDEGDHWFHCDGGAAKVAEQKTLDNFNEKSVDERLEILFCRITALEKKVRAIPYNGPIG